MQSKKSKKLRMLYVPCECNAEPAEKLKSQLKTTLLASLGRRYDPPPPPPPTHTHTHTSLQWGGGGKLVKELSTEYSTLISATLF